MAGWQPEEEGLRTLLACLRNSGAGDTQSQQEIKTLLDSYTTVPAYNAYLVYILTQLPSELGTARTMAGLILKNNLRSGLGGIPTDILQYVKDHIFDAIGDADPMIRNTVSSVITTMVAEIGPENWPEALSKLMELIGSPEAKVQEVSNPWTKTETEL